MRKIVRSHAMIAARAETIFDCLADYQCADVFIEGLEQLTPTGPRTTGAGARFEAVLRVGPRMLSTTIEIASLEPGRSITWTSAGDGGHSLTFDLHLRHDVTSVTLTVSYEEPGGIAGSVIAPFVEITVRDRATGVLERLARHVLPAPGFP